MRDLSLSFEPLDDLLACRRPENPKLHDLGSLDTSYDRFGYITPVVVNDADGMLLEGHGRLETLRRLRERDGRPPDGIRVEGEEQRWLVPVVRGADLTPDEATAFLVAANRITEQGGWDETKLAAVLKRLEETGSGLDGTGFSVEQLDDLLESLGKASATPPPDPDDAPPPPPPRETWVQPGEVYQIGEHRVACGDARDTASLAALFGGDHADALWTDPPYGVNFEGSGRRKRRLTNDTPDAVDALVREAFGAADTVLKPGAALYVAHPAGPLAATFLKAFGDAGWELRQNLVWVKDALVLGHSDYHYRHEPIIYGFKPGPARLGRGARGWFGDDSSASVLDFPRPRSSKQHPTMKPIGLVVATLRNSTRRGDAVLDPFLGSGTTLIAAEQLGRRCIGLELDPAYAQVAIQRWQQLTGRRATLLGRLDACDS